MRNALLPSGTYAANLGCEIDLYANLINKIVWLEVQWQLNATTRTVDRAHIAEASQGLIATVSRPERLLSAWPRFVFAFARYREFSFKWGFFSRFFFFSRGPGP
jgi:hypothetical protein